VRLIQSYELEDREELAASRVAKGRDEIVRRPKPELSAAFTVAVGV